MPQLNLVSRLPPPAVQEVRWSRLAECRRNAAAERCGKFTFEAYRTWAARQRRTLHHELRSDPQNSNVLAPGAKRVQEILSSFSSHQGSRCQRWSETPSAT